MRPYFVLVREEGEDQRIVVPEVAKPGVCGSGETLGGVLYLCDMLFSMVLMCCLEDSRRSRKYRFYTRIQSRDWNQFCPGSEAILRWYSE
jgi:hypothetical protein